MQSFPRVLKNLRESSDAAEKREALTYIQSNSKMLKASDIIKKGQYKEICNIVADIFANGGDDIQHEAYETLNVIISDFSDYTLNLFDAMFKMNPTNRWKILKLLETMEENVILAAMGENMAKNFLESCLVNVQPTKMEWFAPDTCVNNLQVLIDAENKLLSDSQRLQEETINCAITLLRRFYKVATATSDSRIRKFDTLIMDKVVTLAYMGHKRQRGPAIKLLQEALASDIASYVRTKFPDIWTQYKNALQTVYCKRMSVLVTACELDWAMQWNISIQFLGTELHRGAGLINNLLSVEEKAFKSTDTIIRRQAFLSWKLLVDNFALDPQELATIRRIKLLCIPLNAKNSKTELIALTKLEVWWHIIIKLYKDISKFVNPVITQFLNFCFGPLGDTPLLSTKFDVVSSPGKRFFKTKLVAFDALCQLLIRKQETDGIFSSALEERLPHPITDEVFQECYKTIIHSVGEALLILSKLSDTELKNRNQLGKLLWTNLMNYIRDSKAEKKELMYNDILSIAMELASYVADRPMIKDLMLQTILFEISDLNGCINSSDETILSGLILQLLQPSLISELHKKHCDVLKYLSWQCVRSRENEGAYRSCTIELVGKACEKLCLPLNEKEQSLTTVTELWRDLAEILTRYLVYVKENNANIATEHNLELIQSALTVPFTNSIFQGETGVAELAKTWKDLYIQFEFQVDSIATIEPNAVLLKNAEIMHSCLLKNKDSRFLIINCFDILVKTINYKQLLATNCVPSILQLVVDLILYSIDNRTATECEFPLKALSAMLITVYGHDPEKAMQYLKICKPAIDSILVSESNVIMKEIVGTWETVVSIFRGLNKSITSELLSLYKQSITQAINHSNTDVKSQAVLIFDLRTSLSENARCILEEIWKCKGSDGKVQEPVKRKKDGKKSPVEANATGDLLSKTSETSRLSEKQFGKNAKEKSVSSFDSDSKEYVLVKSAVKFDVNRLTEHQKESLKRKRDDIPALYNDLSQSSSQNTENLQEWFDRKSRMNEETEKPQSNAHIGSLIKDLLGRDVNKESETEVPTEISQKETIVENETQVPKCPEQRNVVLKEETSLSKLRTNDEERSSGSAVIADDTLDVTMEDYQTGEKSELIPQKPTPFELPEEYSEDENGKKDLSPSASDCYKRRTNRNLVKADMEPYETSESETGTNAAPTIQRTLRTKVIQGKSIALGTKDTKEFSKDKEESKRGVKRKSDSDNESDGSQRRRRMMVGKSEESGNNENPKSNEGDNAGSLNALAEERNLSQRTKNEISRLRINMVFDSNPLSNRRRSKVQEDSVYVKDVKRHASPENKNVSIISGKSKILDTGRLTSEPGKRGFKAARKGKKGKSLAKPEMEKKSETDIQEYGESQEEDQNEKPAEGDGAVTDTKEDESLEESIAQKPPKKDNQSVLPSNIEDLDNKEANKNLESDLEDIIEDSQEPVGIFKLERLYNEKQCFIKINKIEHAYDVNTSDESALKKDKVSLPEPANHKTDGDVNYEDNKNNNYEVFSNQEIKSGMTTELSGDFDAFSLQNNNDINLQEDGKNEKYESEKMYDKVAEGQVSNSSGLFGFSSPKSSGKRYSKFKSYSAQGRVAHMMGLLTKHDRIESESQIVNLDDEPITKRGKPKEADNDFASVKKDRLFYHKDEKVPGPCSSRQEKIFSNMRSSDYTSSPLLKSFSILRNEEEKIASKSDKPATNAISMNGDDQVQEKLTEGNGSVTVEKDDLPILEWSSANPPSLTASPSASILKRQHRLSMPEPEPESVTPNKRKRVSFADPPVSKEMGYEITSNGSPHKINKFASRGFIYRKDSPSRFKQTRLRLIHADPEKFSKEEETDVDNISEVDSQCERENELLTKIAEELEYPENMTMEIEARNPRGAEENVQVASVTNHAASNKVTFHNFSGEFEVANSKVGEVTPVSKAENGTQATKLLITDDTGVNHVEACQTQKSMYAIERQEQMLPLVDASTDQIDTPSKDSATFKFGVIDDSVLHSLPKSVKNNESLEDTLDAENITGLNSSANSDEIFCGKLIRTSTQAAENVEEQDTLPVTDSMFGSLPLSQDSQHGSVLNDVSCPELLDSSNPIYPTLTSCTEPIACIIDQLINSMWLQHLSAYFTDRNVQTVGDLARMTEREINRMPVKGASKCEFVRSVLKRFERQVFSTGPIGAPSNKIIDRLDCALNAGLSFIEIPEDTTKTLEHLGRQLSNSDSPLSGLHCSQNVESVETSVKNACSCEPDEIFDEIGPSSSDYMQRSSLPHLQATQSSREVSSTDVKLSATQAYAQMHSPDFERTSGKGMKSVGTSTDFSYPSTEGSRKPTKSVSAQMALEDLLDEIDVNLVLQSAARRCSAENILSQYKNKMTPISDVELGKETIRMLGLENKLKYCELALKSVCRSCGVNKVLLRLPDIFSADKQFFVKVLNAYRKKIKPSDCLDILDHEEVKETVCQKCSSSELAEMLSKKLKEEEQQGIRKPIPELLSLDAMLKRMPMDVIISHTVANDELIPSRVVLEIALQNNSSQNIAQALKSQSPAAAQAVFEKLWSPELAVEHIGKSADSKEALLRIFQAVSSKLSPQDLLDAYYAAMKAKTSAEVDSQ